MVKESTDKPMPSAQAFGFKVVSKKDELESRQRLMKELLHYIASVTGVSEGSTVPVSEQLKQVAVQELQRKLSFLGTGVARRVAAAGICFKTFALKD